MTTASDKRFQEFLTSIRPKPIYFVNLFHGMSHPKAGLARGCVRIQSTLCEQSRWSQIIEDLDYNFLYCIARGLNVVLLDCSSRKQVSRACFQGIPLINFVLHDRWRGQRLDKVLVREHNVAGYFSSIELSKRAKAKVDRVKDLYTGGEILLDYDSVNVKEVPTDKWNFTKSLLLV